MSDGNLTITILMNCTAEQAFDAAANVRGWWSENIEGVTDKPNGEFTFRYKDVHRSKHRITEFVKGKRIVWQIPEASLNFVDNRDEWVGTEMRFDISESAGRTELRFTHVGLVPERECYEACSNAWHYYVGDSLKALIMTGHGEPDERESPVGS